MAHNISCGDREKAEAKRKEATNHDEILRRHAREHVEDGRSAT